MDDPKMKGCSLPQPFIMVSQDGWNYGVAAGIITLILCLLLIRLEARKRRNLPPGPPGWPIIGNLLQLGNKPHESLFVLSQKYGPLMSLRLGMRTTIVVSSPAMAKEVLKTQDHVFAGRTVPYVHDALHQSKASLVFAQQGPYWRMLRRISNTNLFTAKKLDSLQSLRKQKVDDMIGDVLNSWRKNKPVDFGRSVLSCSVNLLGNMIFGKDMFDPDSAELKRFKEATWEAVLVHGTPNLADFFPFLRPLDPQGLYRRSVKAYQKLYTILGRLIENRLETLGTQEERINDLLAALLEARSSEYDLVKIRAYLVDMFVAGTETSSATVEWAMAELMKNPPLLKKAQEELDSVVGRDRRVKEEDIERLQVLRAIVKETFRFHPVVPLLLPHRADEQAQVGGYTIPKHSQVFINVWSIGRDPKVWKDPEKFDPERFSNSEIDYRGQHFELIPFGAGRRTCVGLPLASKIVEFMLASLIQCFEWSLPEYVAPAELDMSDKVGLTVQKASPLLIHPSPRLPLHLLPSP